MGLMRLMLGTWVEFSVRYGLAIDPFDPRDNIFAGTAYSRRCTIAPDRWASSLPITRVRPGLNSTWQQANHFQRIPACG
jgi:soluble lytic murein transglycosylase-like protein